MVADDRLSRILCKEVMMNLHALLCRPGDDRFSYRARRTATVIPTDIHLGAKLFRLDILTYRV